MIISLIGFPGSGKTTLGKQLARKLSLNFIDLDHEIEKNEQLSVTEIFKTKGEDYFRQIEANMLKTILTNNDKLFVLSTGGGTPCFFDNIKLLNQYSTTIYIRLPEKTLAQRLSQKEKQKRPLLAQLNNDELMQFVAEKLTQREPYYLQAKYIYSPLDESEKIWEKPWF